jgi:NAD-dependent dihydropyrimidine dehydrogenase PreA subunit
MTGLVYLADVVTLQLDQELCIGCGTCEIVCPHAVFQMTDGLAEVRDRNACMECGACALNCETEAITVRSGVGCASAVISESLGRTDSCCRAVDDSTTA